MVALLFFAPIALPTTANMYISSLGNNLLDGVNVGPYSATVNGVATQVICDDWQDITSIGSLWTANANTLSPLTNATTQLKYGNVTNSQLLYDQAAWLATQILNPPATCPAGGSCDVVGDISYALWELTACSVTGNPTACEKNTSLKGSAFANLTGNDLTNAEWWLHNVPTSFASDSFSNFMIYTPNNANMGPPQEFLADPVIQTPESSVMILFGTDMLGLLGLGLVYRRRVLRPVQ
jgi:hypothetical protein